MWNTFWMRAFISCLLSMYEAEPLRIYIFMSVQMFIIYHYVFFKIVYVTRLVVLYYTDLFKNCFCNNKK